MTDREFMTAYKRSQRTLKIKFWISLGIALAFGILTCWLISRFPL